MRIIIDMGACPKSIQNICQSLSQETKVPIVRLSRKKPELEENLSIIDAYTNDVDVSTFNDMEKYILSSDIFITHNHKLASKFLNRVTVIIHPSGFVYNKANIDYLLYQRYLEHQQRNKGHGFPIRKRTLAENESFKKVLLSYLASVKM